MEIISNNFETLKTARYFLRPSYFEKIKTVWILIHGYAQLGADFLSEFDFIKNEDHLLIAPEGLSKFYFRNKVGASWMTKEDRENEISDYVKYLNVLMQKIKSDYDIEGALINLLGFSQGVHTAARFFINGNLNFDNLILCSSDFPKDADFDTLKDKLKRSKMYFIHGTKDSAISNGSFDSSINLLMEKEVKFENISFEGDHVLNKKLLHDLFCK